MDSTLLALVTGTIGQLPACSEFSKKGDGECDSGNNHPGCDYDGGDCCLPSAANHDCIDPCGVRVKVKYKATTFSKISLTLLMSPPFLRSSLRFSSRLANPISTSWLTAFLWEDSDYFGLKVNWASTSFLWEDSDYFEVKVN